MNKRIFFHTLIFLIVLLLCSYPLFLNLGKMSARMWDESRNGVNSIEMMTADNIFVTTINGQPDMLNTKPPLFFWITALSMKIFGINVLALRIPSALSCLAIVVYLFWFCRRYLNSVIAGVCSCLVLVTSVGLIDAHGARNGDFDTMLTLWIIIYCCEFYLFLQSRRNKHLVAFSVCLALAILTKGIAALMVLPGLSLIVLLFSSHRDVLTLPKFYIIPLIGFLAGVSYYFIREHYNPGYISAVIENEITGRYAGVIEGHHAPRFYYVTLLAEHFYSFWLYALPIAAILVLLRGDKNLKRFCLFLIIQILSYFTIITISSTKLDWYTAPLYPLFALLIGAGFYQLYLEIRQIKVLKSSLAVISICAVLFGLIFIIPVKSILATSIQGTKENNFPEVFYGDFLESVFKKYPMQKNVKIPTDDYNPHVLFYAAKWKTEGKTIDIIPSASVLKRNDTLLVCEGKFLPKLDSNDYYDTIFFEDYSKHLIRVIDATEYKSKGLLSIAYKKVCEILDTPEWSASMKEKAAKNQVEFEHQVIMDALWSLKESHAITPEDEMRLLKSLLPGRFR